MATTMTLISKQTVGSAGATSITFTSIPQTYTDLKLVYSLRSATGTDVSMGLTVNGATTGLSNKILQGNGATAASATSSVPFYAGTVDGSGNTANTFSNGELYIPNYTSSNNKSISADNVDENNSTTAYAELAAGLWSNTSPITSLGLYIYAGYSFVQYSTVYLYGISNSQNQATAVPYASGGDVITTDGVYWYHQFLYSGTFTPKKDLVCDYLVVAGGGGGGNSDGGGGGAGGYRTSIGGSPLSLVANYGYTATVGAGGNGNSTYNTNGNKGSNSSFSNINATGGGYGGGGTNNGGTGGSGGGSAYTGTSVAGNQGGYSPVEGYAGGAGGTGNPNFGSGGGGGSNQVGAAASSSNGGAGGTGTANSINGSNVIYAGGGGGGTNTTGASAGTGGSGGGGAGGARNTAGTNGTANLGGGGGGAGSATVQVASGNGGSGIVVVRYAV